MVRVRVRFTVFLFILFLYSRFFLLVQYNWLHSAVVAMGSFCSRGCGFDSNIFQSQRSCSEWIRGLGLGVRVAWGLGLRFRVFFSFSSFSTYVVLGKKISARARVSASLRVRARARFTVRAGFRFTVFLFILFLYSHFFIGSVQLTP